MKPRENIKVRKIVAAARKAVVPILKPVRPAVKTEARPVSRERHPHLRRVIGAGFGLILLACHAWAQPAVPPPQPASLSEVIAGTEARKFISPKTARDAGLTAPTNGVTAETATNIAAFQAQIATNQLAKANTNLWQPKSDNLTDLAAINGSDEGYLIGGSAANGYHHKLYLGTGLSVTSPGLDYLSLATPLQSFGALANASGVLTNNGSGTFGWYPVASLGGGGGGFWVLDSSSGDYTNLFGGKYDEPSTGKTAFYLGTNQTDYMIEGNLWRANLGIQFGATGGSIDGSGDFDLHDGSVNSLTINGTMSTPTFNVTMLNATNVFGFGTAYWTNAANTFNGTAFTNQSLTASRIMMTGANKQQVSAAASGATPINADGTAVTAIPISMLSDSTNVFYSSNTLDFAVPHASTNMAGNITITTLNGVQNTAYNVMVREWGANGADRTITFPASWRAAPYGGTSVTVTNGTWCKLTLEVQVNYYTNAWFTWAY